ncbi:MAG: SpoVG family protein [Pirellulales bacterium]|nr:SpoVG family protein [Pirellulales bacterium]
MDITEVRIKLMEEPGERLKAFCSITFDNCFVVRDLKIIEGSSGPFVAMPSRKLTSRCPKCHTKNHLRAKHCNQCSATLAMDRVPIDQDGRTKLYADIAHPINPACREMIQKHVIQEFHEEVERAKQPDYVSRYDDFDLDNEGSSRAGPLGEDTPDPVISARVDSAHGKHRAHAPRSGGDAQHISTTKPDPESQAKSRVGEPPQKDNGGFGAGIFPTH